MIQRDVRDAEGTTWTCVQALSSAAGPAAEDAAEQLADAEGAVAVVATPGGGAQSVRLELPKGWAESASDDDLLGAIAAARGGG